MFFLTVSTETYLVYAQNAPRNQIAPNKVSYDICSPATKSNLKFNRHGRQEEPLDTVLLDAISKGDINEIKLLISQGEGINIADKRGVTPLILALSRGYIDVIELLISANADINVQTQYDSTPLLSATICSKAVKLLIDAGADVNLPGLNKQTALMGAIENRNVEAVKILLNAGANISARNTDNKTPLILATQRGNIDIVKILLNSGTKQELNNKDDFYWLLYNSISHGDMELVKIFLSVNANNDIRSEMLFIATQFGQVEIVKLLLNEGAKVNATHPIALTWAAKMGHKELVQILIDAQSDVNVKDDWTPLISAARNNHIEVMKLLLEYGANINAVSYRKTGLMYAVRENKFEAAKFLIEYGADVNIRDEDDNFTALKIAINEKKQKFIDLLIKAGAVE